MDISTPLGSSVERSNRNATNKIFDVSQENKKNELKPTMVAETMAHQKTSATAIFQEARSSARMSHQAVKTEAAPSVVKTGEETDANELLRQKKMKRLGARLEQYKQKMESKWMARQDPKTKSRATMSRKSGKTAVQSVASKKDEKLDSPSTMLKSDEKADAKSPSTEKFPLNKRDQKLNEMLNRISWHTEKRLANRLKLLESLEKKERKRLEQIPW